MDAIPQIRTIHFLHSFIFKFLLSHECIVQGKIIQSFCLFLWPSNAFFIYNCAKMGSMAQLMRQPKREGSAPETEECSSLQVGSWLPASHTNLPRGKPLWKPHRARRFASRSIKAERHEEKQREHPKIPVQTHRENNQSRR